MPFKDPSPLVVSSLCLSLPKPSVTDAVILDIPEELCQRINVLGRPGELLDMVEKKVLGLKKLTEGEVVVSTSIV